MFLALAAISLSACSYNPFNEFTGIDPFNAGNLELTQCYDTLVWEKNDKASTYAVYVYPDDSIKTEDITPVKTTSETYVKLNPNWEGMKIKVFGYSYSYSSTSISDYKKKTVCQSGKVKIGKTSPSSSENLTYGASDMERLLTNSRAKTATLHIPKTVDRLSLSDFTTAYSFHFKFESRPADSPIEIYLSNCEIIGYRPSTLPVFSYEGSNDAKFIFTLFGTNTIYGDTTTDTVSNGKTAIDLPNVYFYKCDEEGSLKVTGGTCYGNNTASSRTIPGYAISAKKIVNIVEREKIQLIGGRGGDGKTALVSGGDGQLPLKKGVRVLTVYPSSIGIKGGNGGDGASGGTGANGGNAYAYSYLTKKAYSRYAHCFYSLGEPSPGLGTGYGTKGKLITDKS